MATRAHPTRNNNAANPRHFKWASIPLLAVLLLAALLLLGLPSRASAHSIKDDPTTMKPASDRLSEATEPGTPPHKHTWADDSSRRGPRFTQRQMSPRAAYQAAMQRMHDAQQQLHRAASAITSPFASMFGGGDMMDPFGFFRGGPRTLGLGAGRRSGHAWPSLWHDPLLDWPDMLTEWPSDYFAHHETTPMLGGEAGTADGSAPSSAALAARRGDSMGSMLASTFDVSEDADKYIVRASVPGWSPEEVRVEVEGNQLILSGERSVHKKMGGGGDEAGAAGEKGAGGDASGEMQQYAYFRKSYTLPPEVKADALRASFDSHTHALRIEVPKPHAAIEPPRKPAKVNVPLQVQGSAATDAEAHKRAQEETRR